MTTDRWSRIYAGQDFLTPGDPESLALLQQALGSAPARLVEVAFGKGEAACRMAEAGHTVLGVDRWLPFVRAAVQRAAARGLSARAAFTAGDGKHLPLPESTMDGGYAFGAPSIVGLEPCLRELARVVRPGGVVVMSDIVWRVRSDGPLGAEWRYIATLAQTSLEEYTALIEQCGLRVTFTQRHGPEAWEAYHAPMLVTAAAERAAGDDAFATQIEQDVELERRAVEQFIAYATFVARVKGA